MIAICLMGPTGVGKTALALELSARFPMEIINVDSVQIYRGLDIGSGKVSHAIRQTIPHHLMDFLDPSLSYSAAQFEQEASLLLADIRKRGKIPLLVGGTMLYFKALQQGLSSLPSADLTLREALEKRAHAQGWPALHAALRECDPLTAARIQPQDAQRIQRALEVYELTGKPLSFWIQQQKPEKKWTFVNVALIPKETARATLHALIAERFESMLEAGLVKEVVTLLKRGETMPALKSVGYRQVVRYLQGESDFTHMQQEAVAATRQLAKRQLTWLRRWPNVLSFDFLSPTLKEEVSQYVAQQLGAIAQNNALS